MPQDSEVIVSEGSLSVIVGSCTIRMEANRVFVESDDDLIGHDYRDFFDAAEVFCKEILSRYGRP